MKLVLTDEMLKLAIQHQNRDLYFEKFEQLVRETYPEWKNVPRNEIYKKFQAVYNREDKIEDLKREREVCIKLMKEQFHVNTYDKEINHKQSKRNCSYWEGRIYEIDQQLIELGYYPGSHPTYNDIKSKLEMKKVFNIALWVINIVLLIWIISTL